MIIIGRCINGICLNGLEYLLDKKGAEMQFNTIKDAKDFLKAKGIEDDELFSFVNAETNEVL